MARIDGSNRCGRFSAGYKAQITLLAAIITF